MSIAVWEREGERRKRSEVVGEIGGLRLGLGRLGFHHCCSNSPEVPAWGRGGAREHKGEQSEGAMQDDGGGEKNILTPDSYFRRPTGGSCISIQTPGFALKLFCIKFSQPQNYLSSPPAKLAFFHQTLGPHTNEI